MKIEKVRWVDLYIDYIDYIKYSGAIKLEDDLAILFTTYLLVSTLGANFSNI